MPKFIVTRREIWTQGVQIEAENKADAVRKVAGGDGEVIEYLLEYSHTRDPDEWTVEEFKEAEDDKDRMEER